MFIMVSNENDEVKFHGGTNRKGYIVALTVAGSDSSGGAGIQADLKTFSALGLYGASAITAITAQNTEGVHSQFAIPSEMVYNQIIAVMEDLQPSVVKIGMLSNAEVASSVADALESYDVPIVLDPVVVSTSGHRLLSAEALYVVKRRLLPIAKVVTPNIPEMHALTMLPLSTISEKLVAARYLISLGAQAVLLKGGHEMGDIKTDILYQHDDDDIKETHLSAPTIATLNTHGTGCTLSSAIAAYIAMGFCLSEAVTRAKEYISNAIIAGADIHVGKGNGPVNHLFNPLKMHVYEK